MTDLLDVLDPDERALLRREALPRKVRPMLATLVDEPFSDPGWIYERKLDGVRTLVHCDGRRVRLRSRNDLALNGAFPEVVEALERRPGRRFVADGEIVAFEGRRTSFARLQGRIGLRRAEAARASGIAITLYLFDLLHVDGLGLRRLPLRRRKLLLARALPFARLGARVRYTPHRNGRGEVLLREACGKGWEGLIAKDAAGPYVAGRSRLWLKLKCTHGQELVIGGFTEPRGARQGFGALLVGHYAGGELRYAGKVGTGFDERTLERLHRKLRRLERGRSPFAREPRVAGAHWVRPELVGEFGFTEWTRDGKLRHPRFLGLRSDKRPRDVRRERSTRRGSRR